MNPFDGSTLIISARSPFARRVRLALREHGIRYEEKVEDVFHPTATLTDANPLARVPVVRLRSGLTLADSNLILQAFYDSFGGGSPFLPTDLGDRFEALSWSAQAYGLCEKVVEYFLETLRPEDRRDPEVLAEYRSIVERLLPQAEKRLAGRPSFFGSGLTQADLDWGTALAYMTLRDSSEWRERFPALAAYLDSLDARESFIATRPPKA